MTPENKVKELLVKIADLQKEIATIGVENNLSVYLELPDGYHSVSLVTKAFIEETLANYGWEASDKSEDPTLEELEQAFESETGVDVKVGDWISSSSLC